MMVSHGFLCLRMIQVHLLDRTFDPADVLATDVGVKSGGSNGRMPQEDLNDADVGSVLQKMGGESVSQDMGRDVFGETGFFFGLFQSGAHGGRADALFRFGAGKEIRFGRPNDSIIFSEGRQ